MAIVPIALLAGCGSDEPRIALLLPENRLRRYESIDRPAFERTVKALCGSCRVGYRNAEGREARQLGQARAALGQGADVLVLDPVQPESAAPILDEAKRRGVPVLDYDSLILPGRPTAFVSFDHVRVGELEAEALGRRLKERKSSSDGVVMINGETGNRDQHLFEEGARDGFAAASVKIVRRYETPFWEPGEARREMDNAISVLGKTGFAGVYAETDGIAGGAIKSMEAAGIDPARKPTTGHDATVQGVRRILTGKQLTTVYEPVAREATAAARVAVALARGDDIPAAYITGSVDNSKFQVPAILINPVEITKANVVQVLIATGALLPSHVCAGAYAVDCRAAGIERG